MSSSPTAPSSAPSSPTAPSSPAAPSSPQHVQEHDVNGSAEHAGSREPSNISTRASASIANMHPPSIVLVVVLNASEASKSMRKVALAHPYTYASLQDKVAKSLHLSSTQTLYFTYKESNTDDTEWRIDDEDVLELFRMEFADVWAYPHLTAVVVDKMDTHRFHGDASIDGPVAATPSASTVQLGHMPASSSTASAPSSLGAKASSYRTVPCSYFNKGFCKNGDECKFLHCCKHCGGDHARMDYCNEPKKHMRRRQQQQQQQPEEDARSEAGSTDSKRIAGDGAVEQHRRAPHQSDKTCHAWNTEEGCDFGDTCNFVHECMSCEKTSHASYACPEKKPYYCKRCNVSMKGQSRYHAHVATEEHQEKDKLARLQHSGVQHAS